MLHGILRASDHQAARLADGLRWIEVDGLGALVADQQAERIQHADTASLKRYADLLALIHERATLIPMRFGCLLASDAAVRDLLTRRRERLQSLIAHIDGCVEFGIRLLPTGQPQSAPTQPARARAVDGSAAPDVGPGRAYLARIRERLHEDSRLELGASEARARIERQVAGLFRDLHTEHAHIAGQDLISLSFLIPRDAAERFVARLRQAPPGALGVGLLTGPWPPYNFVGAIDDDLRVLA